MQVLLSTKVCSLNELWLRPSSSSNFFHFFGGSERFDTGASFKVNQRWCDQLWNCHGCLLSCCLLGRGTALVKRHLQCRPMDQPYSSWFFSDKKSISNLASKEENAGCQPNFLKHSERNVVFRGDLWTHLLFGDMSNWPFNWVFLIISDSYFHKKNKTLMRRTFVHSPFYWSVWFFFFENPFASPWLPPRGGNFAHHFVLCLCLCVTTWYVEEHPLKFCTSAGVSNENLAATCHLNFFNDGVFPEFSKKTKAAFGLEFIYCWWKKILDHVDIVYISLFTGFHTCQVVSRITEPSTRRLAGPRNPRSVSAPESEEMKKQSVRANSIVARPEFQTKMLVVWKLENTLFDIDGKRWDGKKIMNRHIMQQMWFFAIWWYLMICYVLWLIILHLYTHVCFVNIS